MLQIWLQISKNTSWFRLRQELLTTLVGSLLSHIHWVTLILGSRFFIWHEDFLQLRIRFRANFFNLREKAAEGRSAWRNLTYRCLLPR